MRTTRSVTLLSVAVLVSFTSVLGACGSDDDGDSGATSSSTSSSVAGKATPPDGLVSTGELTVCSDTPYEPFEFEGPDGQQTGYDIDLLRAVAATANLTLDVKDLVFDGIIAALAAGQCDVIGSALSIKPERAEQVDFSTPYFDADQSVLVNKADQTKYATLASLTGQKIGVQKGTTGATYANEHKPEGATIIEYPDADSMFQAMVAKKVVALLQDLPVNAYRATKDDLFVVTETFPTGEQYGFAVAKGKPAVLEFVNQGLATLRSDGTFDEIYAKYFGESK